MIAPTHVAFAVALGTLGGAPEHALKLMAGGSLLPDLDHPQSSLGRIFFFLSIPLNKYLGHRQSFHGFPLWGVFTLLGIFYQPLLWIGLGAVSHVFIDSLNVNGVQGLAPFSEKSCVLVKRNWRFYAGSREELFLMCALGILAWSGGYIGSMGGLRGLLSVLTGSYQIAYQQYTGAGRKVCYIKGKLRSPSGNISEGRWLVLGKEGSGQMSLAIWDEKQERILHVPKKFELLRARLVKTEKTWNGLEINGWARTRKEAFFFDGKKWIHASPDSMVFGAVVSREELELY